MSRITRREQVFDHDLEQQGLRRIYQIEYVVAGSKLMPIYREKLIPADANDSERTPWWSRKKPARRRKS